MEEKKRVIDKRKKEKFMVDDEYLNGMAKLCGWQGTIVYNSLCRHANAEQESFPSIKLMAEQHNVSRPTIFKGITNLENRKVISIKKKRTKDGKWLNNSYTLLDKTEWDYSQVNVVDTVSQVNVATQPSQRGLPDVVNVVDTKETHSEGNTYKETHITISEKTEIEGKDINLLLEKFKPINPSYEQLYKRKNQREALTRLTKKYTYAKMAGLITALPELINKPYAPQITTPMQLEEKLGRLLMFIKGNNMPRGISLKNYDN